WAGRSPRTSRSTSSTCATSCDGQRRRSGRSRAPGLPARPLVVEHAEPRGVAVAVLHDVVGLLNALEREAVRQRGAARALVERVALPLDAAVAEVERVPEHEVGDLARGAGALGDRAVPDAAELD